MKTERWFFTRPRPWGLLCGLTLAVAQFFTPAGVGTAQAATTTCTPNGAVQNCTVTFEYSGAAETWTVPAGVAEATFELYGAQGGHILFRDSVWGAGGAGGKTTATLTVQPGASYQINVGGQGQFAPIAHGVTAVGGFNGGGNSHSDGWSSAGGGASDIRTGSYSLAERVLVAGGGGGAGSACGSSRGGNGGAGGGISGAAGAASGLGVAGGEGGAQDQGGQIGGSFGVGGAGGIGYYGGGGGGGGGGGYFGGGGGSANCAGGGGGGGSGYGPAGVAFQTGVRTGNGLVIIRYDLLSDTTPPIVTQQIVGTLGANGWYISDVAISWSVVDDESAISSQSGCAAQNVTSDTLGVTFTCSATSAGGNSSQSVTIQRDATAPTVSAAATTQPNGTGWYNSDVTVQFTCNDNLSGVVSCPADQILSSEGSAVSSAAQTITDQAGNSSAASNVVTVQLDKTDPVVTVTGVSNGASYILGSTPAAGCSTNDTLSGVATQATVSVTGGNADGTGSFTATCSGATDTAGNSGSASVTYSVIYNWSGFFQPVDNLPTVNTVNAGPAIPVKFSLGGNFGLNIFASGYPKVQTVACPGAGSGGSSDVIEETVTAGNNSLQYDPTTQTYTYVWKSDKAWAGTCRQLIVKLIDGTEHSALFQFNGKVRSAGESDTESSEAMVQRVFLPLVNQ